MKILRSIRLRRIIDNVEKKTWRRCTAYYQQKIEDLRKEHDEELKRKIGEERKWYANKEKELKNENARMMADIKSRFEEKEILLKREMSEREEELKEKIIESKDEVEDHKVEYKKYKDLKDKVEMISVHVSKEVEILWQDISRSFQRFKRVQDDVESLDRKHEKKKIKEIL